MWGPGHKSYVMRFLAAFVLETVENCRPFWGPKLSIKGREEKAFRRSFITDFVLDSFEKHASAA